MNIDVNYIDAAKKVHALTIGVSLPAFLKHLALAGQGEEGGVLKALWRGTGALMFHGRYLDANIWRLNGLRRSAPYLKDPTDQGDFSTLAGRAIADFLAKKLLQAKFTHSYEGAMYMKGFPLRGPRPDFYCTTLGGQQFAMEAKGFDKKSISVKEMATHKAQSTSGPLPVNFSVASVLYNCYDSPRCKFHDPVGREVPFDEPLNSALATQYYLNLLEELDSYLFRTTLSLGQREFEAYDVSTLLLVGRGRTALLLIDARLRGMLPTPDVHSVELESIDTDTIYVDADGVGVILK